MVELFGEMTLYKRKTKGLKKSTFIVTRSDSNKNDLERYDQVLFLSAEGLKIHITITNIDGGTLR